MTCPAGKKPDLTNQTCVNWPIITDTDYIADCLEYHTRLPDTTCTKCINSKLLNQNECLTTRIYQDSNCTSYHPNLDYCLTFASGFSLSPDRFSC